MVFNTVRWATRAMFFGRGNQIIGLDPDFYSKYYGDLQHLKSHSALQNHFMRHGRAEGRYKSLNDALARLEASRGPLPTDFSIVNYKHLNQDLADTFDCDFQYIIHYLEMGRNEGRIYKVQASGTEPLRYHSRLAFIRECNNRAIGLIPEFRQYAELKLPDGFDQTFYKYRFENPYFGYVEIYNDGCAPFYMLNNNDDLVAQHYFWYGRNGYETASVREWISRVKKVAAVFDVGAHTGLFSLLSCRSNATAKVVAFEPTVRAFARVLENLNVNALIPRVQVERMAISDHSGSVELMHYESEYMIGTGASILGTEKHWDVDRREICEATSLDDYITESGIDPDVLKIDVEGAEILALAGARDLISRKKATFFIEVLPTTVDGVVALLDGYDISIIDDKNNATVPYERSLVEHYTNILATPKH